MRAMIRNTTALTSALAIAVSLVSPGFVQAQTVAEACGANRLTLHESDLQAAGLDLPDPFRRALAGEPVDGAIRLVETDGRRALCLTPDDLGRMGADQQQLAMLQDADAKAAAIPGSGAQQATGQAQQAAEEAQNRSQRPAQPGENAQARQEQAAEQAERAQQQAAEDAQQQAAEEDRPQQEQAAGEDRPQQGQVSEGGPAQQEQQERASDDPAQQEPQQQASDDEPAQQPQQEQASDDERAQQQPQQQASDDGPAQQAPQQEQQQASDDDPAQQQEQEQASGAPSDDSELAREMQRIEERAADAVDPVREAERAEAEAPQRSVAAADADEAQGDATVEEETVTEEGSRSSSEEFAEPVNRPANDTADADGARSAGAAPGERDGMSDLEKALLVGLGAVVVGQALGGDADAEVVQKTDDRVVVLKDGRYRVIRDDNELIERPGSNVRRETFEDGSTRTTVTRENGVRIVTIRDPGLRVLRRVRIGADGTRTVLIDDMQAVQPVDVTQLPQAAPEVSANDLRAALQAQSSADRSFALYQVRNISQVRKLVPAIPLEAINFRTGSAVIEPEEAQELSALGNLIADRIRQNPDELFLIEGHTDAVGNAAYNLALSDRRAESVALALTEYFDVPPENMVVQGYGEADLKVKTLTAERANRRAAVRRITPLLRQQG